MGTKISDMALATPTGSEELEVNAGGITKKVTAQAIADLAPAPPPPSVAAADVSFSNGASGLAATDVQGALDELDAAVDVLEAAPPPTVSAAGVSFNNAASGLSAANVQAALDEIDADVDALQAASIAASAVSFNNAASGLAATNVQAALNEIDADVDALQAVAAPPKVVQLACSDETTALAAGTGKITFRMPYAMTVSAVRASLTTAQASGSIFTVDINEAGASILSTKLTIDNTEKTSVTAATAAVISDAALADDAEVTIDIDQIGDGTAKGLKIAIIGT